MKEKQSTDIYVDLPDGVSRNQIMGVVERAANATGLYIPHIGGYSPKISGLRLLAI